MTLSRPPVGCNQDSGPVGRERDLCLVCLLTCPSRLIQSFAHGRRPQPLVSQRLQRSSKIRLFCYQTTIHCFFYWYSAVRYGLAYCGEYRTMRHCRQFCKAVDVTMMFVLQNYCHSVALQLALAMAVGAAQRSLDFELGFVSSKRSR